MKGIILALSFTFIILGCSTKLHVPLKDVELINQDEGFFSGTNELPVVLEKAHLNPENSYYTVYGYVNLLMVPDRSYAKHPNIKISLISNGDTTFLTKTKKWGKFKIKMQNVDTALFNFEQWKILKIHARYP